MDFRGVEISSLAGLQPETPFLRATVTDRERVIVEMKVHPHVTLTTRKTAGRKL